MLTHWNLYPSLRTVRTRPRGVDIPAEIPDIQPEAPVSGLAAESVDNRIHQHGDQAVSSTPASAPSPSSASASTTALEDSTRLEAGSRRVFSTQEQSAATS